VSSLLGVGVVDQVVDDGRDRDEVEGIAIGDLKAELLFGSEKNLNTIQTVDSKIFDEVRLSSHLFLINLVEASNEGNDTGLNIGAIRSGNTRETSNGCEDRWGVNASLSYEK